MLSFKARSEYGVVFVSFNARETPDMGAKKKAAALSHYGRPETAAGWHFLTGKEEQIHALTSAANFRYSFDEKNNLFAHASGIMLITPDGRISRYFYGVEYPSRDVRLGLVDASAGKIGTPIDHLLLFCFHYDPETARYSTTILKIIRLCGILTIFSIVAVIFQCHHYVCHRVVNTAKPPTEAASAPGMQQLHYRATVAISRLSIPNAILI